jgi:lysine-ketoglutarate reductase/saccharopine dehydrogenase-like protein (TIGR00300 family)
VPFELKKYHEPDFLAEPLASAPDAQLRPAPADGVAPEGYHALSIFPEYFKIDGQWRLLHDIMMDDAVRMTAKGEIEVVPPRNLRVGDRVALGRSEHGDDGILVWSRGFETVAESSGDQFSFRQGRSRETSYSVDYDRLVDLLRYERETGGNVLWVMGPAFTFDAGARSAMQAMVEAGYVDGVMGGNALATHDLEGAVLHTALGQDIYTQESMAGGHYNHIDIINEVRRSGSIKQFVEDHHVSDGIMYALVKHDVPFVLAGSIRDDGPLPEVIGDAYDAQDAMYDLIRKSTTIICMATMLHSIATGNLAASYCVDKQGRVRPKFFYAVDATEFAVNKLRDRGSLSATTIVTNARDFINNVARGVGALD